MGESLFHLADFHGFLHGFRNVESLKRWSKTNERHGLCPLPMLEAPRKGKKEKNHRQKPGNFCGFHVFFWGVYLFFGAFFGVPFFGGVKHVNSWVCVGKCDEFIMEGYFFFVGNYSFLGASICAFAFAFAAFDFAFAAFATNICSTFALDAQWQPGVVLASTCTASCWNVGISTGVRYHNRNQKADRAPVRSTSPTSPPKSRGASRWTSHTASPSISPNYARSSQSNTGTARPAQSSARSRMWSVCSYHDGSGCDPSNAGDP